MLLRLIPVIVIAFTFLSACSGISPSRETQPAMAVPPTGVTSPNPTVLPATTVATQTEITISPQVIPTSKPTQPAASIPDPIAYTWAPLANGITAPTDIQSPRDGSGRLFILEQPGRIRILKNGKLIEPTFLDISDRVGSSGSEQGLLGLAFHPKFSQNGFFFINYTGKDGNTRISRFSAVADEADPASEKVLMLVQQPFANHNGGALAFDPQGYLMIGLGDGGSAGDPYGNAQSGNSLLGKLLRINVDQGEAFAIPPDNPNSGSTQIRQEIWASGLRNPWRFSFDQFTGDLWIADVGQNLWEEINFVPAGKPGGLNFGWNKMEATHPFKGSDKPAFVVPVAEYPHGPECSVTGGYVYRGLILPEWQGVYLFGDFCTGAIWGLPSPPQGAPPVSLFMTGFKISTFGQDESGELYLADYSGTLYRLENKH